MDELYAIVVKRAKRADYYWPVVTNNPLKTIDEYFTKYKRIGVLELMRQNDSVLTETNPDTLVIKKNIKGKLIEEKNLPIIEDFFVLSFSLKAVLDHLDKSDINRIHNHLMIYKSKNVSFDFKKIIDLLKNDQEEFLNAFSLLSYPEQRIIRVIINNNVDIYKLLDVKKEEEAFFASTKNQTLGLMKHQEDEVSNEQVIILERFKKNELKPEMDKCENDKEAA